VLRCIQCPVETVTARLHASRRMGDGQILMIFSAYLKQIQKIPLLILLAQIDEREAYRSIQLLNRLFLDGQSF